VFKKEVSCGKSGVSCGRKKEALPEKKFPEKLPLFGTVLINGKYCGAL
jgi:hypothetical protein